MADHIADVGKMAPDSAVTAAELDALIAELRENADKWELPGMVSDRAADAIAALRKQLDARDEALRLAASASNSVIADLRADNAKKDAALRKIAGLDYKNAATNMAAYKAVQIATDALTPASQEAPASPAEKAQAIMDDWRENRPGDWVGDKEYWEAPASPEDKP